MSWGRGLLHAAISMISLAVAGCQGAEPTSTLSYRETVVYDANGTEVSASGVTQLASGFFAGGASGPGITSTAVGEALGAKIPGFGYAFLMFGPTELGEGSRTIISEACGVPRLVTPTRAQAAAWLKKVEVAFAGKCELPKESWPLVVLFSDPADKTTARALSPLMLPAGLSIKSITVEPTKDDVTFGTTDVLTWIKDQPANAPLLQVPVEDGVPPVTQLPIYEGTFMHKR